MGKLRLVVLGMMGRCPFGGQSWLYLNWLLGLAANGHEVWYIEDDTVWPFDPIQDTITGECEYAVNHIRKTMRRVGMEDRWAYRLGDDPKKCWGMAPAKIDELYRSCDALLNVCGATLLREPQMAAKVRVYLETDPVTWELRLANGDELASKLFAQHNAFVTYGENYGRKDCGVPLNGIRFKKTRQPIDLDLWPMMYDAKAPHFTTIGNYRQNGWDIRYKRKVYRWSKHHEWERFIKLPKKADQAFELAMNCNDTDRAFIEGNGWKVVSPFKMSLDIFGAYPAYFRQSRAEFTVAKDQNIRLNSGWFSERDACYLACGKPVIAQDTGFGTVLPTGKGLFRFTTMDEAVEAVEQINADYHQQCRAARAIAREFFDARKIAKKMLDDVGL